MSEPFALCATQAIDALLANDVSALELTQSCLSRIAGSAQHSSAFSYLDSTAALSSAAASDQRRARGLALHPLDGIPCGVSDSIAVQGWPLVAGLATRKRSFAQEDAHCIAKLRRAGAVILGKLQVGEGGFGRDAHGGTGASESARAVVSGLCALAIGTDTLGSLRVPAAWSGAAAFKPSFARVSQRGLISVSHRFDQAGPIARKVADLSVVFQQISGVDALDPYSRTVPLHHIERRPQHLTIGVVSDMEAHGVSAEIIALYERTMTRLAGLLPRREIIGFNDFDFARKRRSARLLCAAELAVNHADDLRDQPENFSVDMRAFIATASGASAHDLVQAEYCLDLARVKARRVFGSIDVLLMPTTASVAPIIDTAASDHSFDFASFADFAGLPALTLCMGETSAAKPAGLQLIGPRGSDLQLLALGECIEDLLGESIDFA